MYAALSPVLSPYPPPLQQCKQLYTHPTSPHPHIPIPTLTLTLSLSLPLKPQSSYGIYATYLHNTALQAVTPPLPIPALTLAVTTCSHLVTMLLFSLGILLSSPPNKRLPKLNIWVLLLADLTHWAGLFSTIASTVQDGSGSGIGYAPLFDMNVWNRQSQDTWVLALYPIGTAAFKVATLLSVFGRIKG